VPFYFLLLCSDVEHEFLAFKTKEEAEEFLGTNIKEIRLAKDFIACDSLQKILLCFSSLGTAQVLTTLESLVT
jgi:hypothetical protein